MFTDIFGMLGVLSSPLFRCSMGLLDFSLKTGQKLIDSLLERAKLVFHDSSCLLASGQTIRSHRYRKSIVAPPGDLLECLQQRESQATCIISPQRLHSPVPCSRQHFSSRSHVLQIVSHSNLMRNFDLTCLHPAFSTRTDTDTIHYLRYNKLRQPLRRYL